MAMFEQKISLKSQLDDTTPLTCTIEAAHNLKDHTEYVIRVQRGPVPEHSWTVTKRYSEFSALANDLRMSGICLPLPPKKVIGKMDREFIAERQQGLQVFLNAMMNHQMLSSCHTVKIFLDPDNYTWNLQEVALQHISMFFRSEPRWEVIEPVPEIGWRIRKKYFMIKDRNQPKEKFVLSWCSLGPDKFLGDKDLDFCMKSLPTFQHPHIYPVAFATSNETSGIAIRKFYEFGTLRDKICKSKPRQVFLKKYGNPKICTGCAFHEIRTYGRQILETLKYLHEKGFYYGHLHAGNVLVDGNNRCQLLDLENCLLGLPSYYRGYYTQFKHIQALDTVDVYCFGQLLYEITFGEPLNCAVCDNFPPHCPPELRSVLESILTTEACKNGPPSVSDLLQHPLFRDVILPPPADKIQVKIPTKAKQPLKDAFSCVEKRLHAEQKVIHHYRRISKAQAFHMSEDEKKKRRRSKRKELLEREISEDTTPTPATDHSTHNGFHSKADSTSSSSEATTTSTVPPPPSAPPVSMTIGTTDFSCPMPNGNHENGENTRGALLNSICGFSKNSLKKSDTIDKSSPKI